MKKALLFVILTAALLSSKAQIISGPMLGPVELRDARIWAEVSPLTKKVQLIVKDKAGKTVSSHVYKGELGKPFNPVQFEIGGLAMNTSYTYSFVVDGKPAPQGGTFTTKDLWQYRKPAPDFSFLTGSCAYFNEPQYDRPGKPYGGDSSIFETMAKEKAAFMLWLGDNWYSREVDYYSQWGLWYRAHHDRRMPVLQNFLKAMPHLAIWDDHDYGPNDIGSSYILKESSRDVFMAYWLNKSYGLHGEGIFSQYSHGDVDFFLLDDRWWRSTDRMQDSVNGQPNPEKQMLGEKQLTWLKNALLYSTAAFKIVAIGSQVLNPVSPYDKFSRIPIEFNNLTTFLTDYKIDGVLFLTGDRHHTEIIKVARPGTYPLYDITVSPLTSGTYPFSGPEAANPYRVFGVAGKQNYGRISVSGAKGARKLMVTIIGVKGENLGDWSVMENEIKTPKN